MTTMATTAVTLNEFSQRLGPDKKVEKNIIEQLAATNEILEDAVFLEGNLPTGHKTTIRTGLPEPTWRLLNYGVQPSKSTTAQVTDTCGMLENYSEIDKDLADLNGNSAAWRLSEDVAVLEGMNQEMASTLFYGNTAVNPERFMGLAPRFSALSTDTTKAGSNIISASGASNCTSIYLVGWGQHAVHGIFPKGSTAGISTQDLGEQTLLDGNSGRYQGYRTHYQWKMGLCVRDWRYVVRIANIDVTALTKAATAGADLIDLMAQAQELIHRLTGVKAAFYCNKTIKSFLRRQIVSKVAASTLTMEQVGGKPVMVFGETPVRRCDEILNSETVVA